MEIQLKSEITCPNCGHKKKETMPTDACQFFYECENCKKVLKPHWISKRPKLCRQNSKTSISRNAPYPTTTYNRLYF